MALKIFLSAELNKLADKLSKVINEKSKDNPFVENFVVIQTEGLKRWVSIKIAEKQGVSFLNTFLRPNNLIEEIFKLAGLTENTYPPVFDISWYLFELLNEDEFKEKFKIVSNYYTNNDKKRYSLAFLLADIFDQYQIYRSEYIDKWNKNENISFKKDNEQLKNLEEWQKYLWLKLKERLKTENENITDRVELIYKFKELYDKNENNIKEKIKKKFSVVHLFGFSYFTRYHLEILINVLSKDIDVYFYLFNPAPNIFWYDEIKEKLKLKLEQINSHFNSSSTDIFVGNRLLMDFGTVARNTMKLIFDVGGDNIFNVIEQMDNEYSEEKPTFLKKIQDAIINDKTEDIEFTKQDIKDGTLQIHKHYSDFREVEGVYNFILKKMEEGVQPHEILVMTTDIDKYTPYIQAVFDNYKPNIENANRTNTNEFVPYRIADRSFDKEENLINIFRKILELKEHNFTPEFVLSILDFEPVRNKFGIKDVNNIRHLLSLANIRLFLEGRKEDETELISWRKGLKRLLAGYMMLEDRVITINNEDILPIKQVEGTLADETLLLIPLIVRLCKWIEQKNDSKTISEWVERVLELLKNLFDEENAEISSDYDFIVQKIADFERIQYDDKISFDVFYEGLSKVLVSGLRGRNFISGAVTFASIIPLRSVPYKVIAVLGLGSENFPRLDNLPSFNLLKYEKKWQDRSKKDGDNYLFLETLLSAQDSLYLSYVGWDIKLGKEKPASSVIDILSSFIVENCKDCEYTDLIIPHSLHLYYVKEDKKNSDYSYVDFSSDTTEWQNDKQITDEEVYDKLKESNFYTTYHLYKGEIKKKNFDEIYRDWFLAKFFNVKYDVEDLELPEKEIVSIDDLTKYNIKKRILEIKLFEKGVNDELEHYKNYLKHKGDLPLSVYGEKVFKELIEEVDSFLEGKGLTELPYTADEVEFETIVECNGNEYTVKGKFNDVIKEKHALIFMEGNANIKAVLLSYLLANNNKEEEKNKVDIIIGKDKTYKISDFETDNETKELICFAISLAEKLLKGEIEQASNDFESRKEEINKKLNEIIKSKNIILAKNKKQ